MCPVHSYCELIKPATSVYIVQEQFKRHRPVVHTLVYVAKISHVVRALFDTRVFFKFKSRCTVSKYQALCKPNH